MLSAPEMDAVLQDWIADLSTEEQGPVDATYSTSEAVVAAVDEIESELEKEKSAAEAKRQEFARRIGDREAVAEVSSTYAALSRSVDWLRTIVQQAKEVPVSSDVQAKLVDALRGP
eukprot:IDg17025t1